MAQNGLLRVSDHALSDTALQELTLDLAQALRDSGRIEAEVATSEAKIAGAKSAAALEILGQLALAFITSGAAVALIEALRAYFVRSESLEFELVGNEGRSVKIVATDLSEENMERLIQEVHSVLDN